MRVVFDTSVVIAALRSPTGASAALLRSVREGRVTMIASVPLFIEYEAVAMRREHLAAAGASRADIANALDVLAGFAEPVEVHYLWRPILRDPGDDMVLEAAVNGRADIIITFNEADFAIVLPQFNIEVLRPGELVRRML
jgi:putative PIN family toxin of toxin-antitoxin system